ncbi:hypothetical protein GRZ55_11340 [Chelativorans sp. ZYF759]|uniref:helix-turn-helix domain-containing protein n=1 Tax=Chelativorans sp. ZYF759 TaxID=2692213 RepID=UPI00145EA1F6|nr:hypothetical protein [Chelativorans sp. ZYF759]NMG39838.1 hypothetical protein [Chelativorans sp. ZYF759]
MELRHWRLAAGKSQGECAMSLGLDGGARSFQRIETGQNKADADLVERIAALTEGAVAAQDMHATRLDWLRANRPERFLELGEAAE